MHGQENYSQLKKILSIFYGNGVYYRSTFAKIRKVFKKIIIIFNFNTCTFKVLYFWHPNFLMQTNWNHFILYSFYLLLLNYFEFYRMAEIWIQSNNIIIFVRHLMSRLNLYILKVKWPFFLQLIDASWFIKVNCPNQDIWI